MDFKAVSPVLKVGGMAMIWLSMGSGVCLGSCETRFSAGALIFEKFQLCCQVSVAHRGGARKDGFDDFGGFQPFYRFPFRMALSKGLCGVPGVFFRALGTPRHACMRF